MSLTVFHRLRNPNSDGAGDSVPVARKAAMSGAQLLRAQLVDHLPRFPLDPLNLGCPLRVDGIDFRVASCWAARFNSPILAIRPPLPAPAL